MSKQSILISQQSVLYIALSTSYFDHSQDCHSLFGAIARIFTSVESTVVIMTLYQLLLLLAAVVALTVSDDGKLANQTENWKKVAVPCQGIEFVDFILKSIENKTRVVLADCQNQNYVVNSNLNISFIDKLLIHRSQPNFSRIYCTSNTVISFTNVTNLYLENLYILNCGNERQNGGLKITNCTNVTLNGVTIENSWRTGLTMINVRGKVLMEYSNFLNNGRHQSNLTQQLLNSTYNDFHERGGGMQVMIGDGQANGSFMIRNCNFLRNSASHGGGLFLVLHEEATGNRITIDNTVFEHNDCQYGGGGVQIGYVQEDPNRNTITNNSILFKQCNFYQNTAKYGGGTTVFSTLGSLEFSKNVLTFSSCNWTNNSAILGLAMDISVAPWETLTSRRHLPSPVFIDCVFSGNRDTSVIRSPFILNKPRGILVVTKFRLEFRNFTLFIQNLGSAIEATSATLDFQPNSNVHFIENKGLQGAAMNLKASTEVIIRDNSFFLFKNNNATYSGGAIYVEFSDKHSFFTSKRCFFRYVGGEEPKNVTLTFENNFAAVDSLSQQCQLKDENIRHHGDSIFATSVIPCFEKCIQSLRTDVSLPITDTLKCIGQFSFNPELDTRRRQISTSPHHFAATETTSSFEYNNMCSVIVNITNNTMRRNPNYQPERYNPFEGPLHLIPGKSTKIPLRLVDDLCAEVFFVVQVRVVSSEMDSLIIHAAHSVVTDNSLTLYGEENDTGHIQLTTFGIRAISVTIKVTMDQCPPGYIHNNYDGLRACRCSSIDRMNYRGIERCHVSEFRAYVKHGYWVGYVKNRSESSLASALCPKGFCINNTAPPKEHLLPANISEDISLYICNANRTGRICGSCKENHSAYYHSMSFYCGSSDLCHLGWLFYILSELIPVTILFLVVIVFNISFTSGPLNGVIFFIQMIDTLKIKAENFIWFDTPLHTIAQLYQSVFRMFTLNFFSHQHLSFCLIRHASAMDVLAFKYITIIYSLLLVFGTVFLLKICNFKLCGRSPPSLKGSIIHGLSGFLVMSYSECTRVSLMILTKSHVYVGSNSENVDFVTFYNGDYSYMGPEHLKYAIPAIIFIQTMVAIPPLLLLTYPLCYKLFALLRIEESKCVQMTCKMIIPLEKTKPLFDSIQGAFKDRYRFFAGLYFLYRLCALLSFTLSNTLTTHYTLTGALLVSMLTLHATFCPYKKRWHNILDAILFCNLIIINTITHYNYSLSFLKFDSTTLVTVMISLQCVLILLPLVYLIAFTIY